MNGQKITVIIGMSNDSIYTIKMAQKYDIFVVGVDGNPNAEGFKYVDKIVIADISNLELIEQIIDEIKPDFTLPVPIGKYLSTIGWVNSKFGLKGISEEATMNSVDKYLYHRKLYANGLRNIKAYLIPKCQQGEKTYDITYPAILKPRYGSGSRGIFYICSHKELKDNLENIQEVKEDYILEEAIEGIEYGVDGAVINGELKLILIRKKINTQLPQRQAISYLSVSNTSMGVKRISNQLSQVIKVLNYNNCLLHADVIVNEKNVFIVEISPRPSGHNLHSMFVPEATGVDMVNEYIKFLLGKPVQFVPSKVKLLQIRYFDFQYGVIKRVPTRQELVSSGKCKIIRWECQIQKGDYMNQVVDGYSLMGRGFFIIEGDSETELLKQSQWILSQFELEEDYIH